VAWLIEAFNARGATSSSASKLDILMDLERLDDPRIVPFLVGVLADESQPMEVRIHLARQLRNGRLAPDQRRLVAPVLGRLLHRECALELRLQATLALGEFADVGDVLAALGTLALAQDEPIDLRYSAFTSVQRAGPTPECVALLQELSRDETLGRAAMNVLAAWGARELATTDEQAVHEVSLEAIDPDGSHQ
jgi:hypothetical protein